MNKENSFNFERYLESYENSEVSLEDYFDVVALERLCKKVDVVKKLYTLYSPDLKVRRSDKEISNNCYLVFFKALRDYAFKSKDFKYLNTYLKLLEIMKSKNFLSNEQTDNFKLEVKKSLQEWMKGEI
jgi:hypothetical protein